MCAGCRCSKGRVKSDMRVVECNDWRRCQDEPVIVVDVCLRDEALDENGKATQEREQPLSAFSSNPQMRAAQSQGPTNFAELTG